MSGLEFANKIRELNSDVKIFLIGDFDTVKMENNLKYKKERPTSKE